MTEYALGLCPVCRAAVYLTVKGTTRKHTRQEPGVWISCQPTCPGTGQPATERVL